MASELTVCATPGAAFGTQLRLTGFRNYREAVVELSIGRNIFIGENGQGKSNLLEGVYALATTRSFRGAKDSELIGRDFDSATAAIEVGEERVEISLTYKRGGRRSAAVFGNPLPRVQDIIGRMPAVCFSSADLDIAAGEPAARRRFLDTELSLTSPAYLGAFSGYKRSLEQRNAVLRAIREGVSGRAALEPWTTKAAEYGAAMRQIRREYVEWLAGTAAEQHGGLSGGEEMAMVYVPSDSAASAEELAAEMDARVHADIAIGSTGTGPHRDELAIRIQDLPARSYASQGQARTAVLSIKLAAAIYWKERLGMLPVLLLDDVMSDLDQKRKEQVLSITGEMGQVLITATDVGQIPEDILAGAKVFKVSQGMIYE